MEHMKWKDPYLEYPKPNRWILLVDNAIAASGGKIKSHFTTSPEDRNAVDHIPIERWSYIFDRYIYMEELFHTLADEAYMSEKILEEVRKHDVAMLCGTSAHSEGVRRALTGKI